MAVNRDSNAYTLVFATIMVIVVGGLLAFISSTLKPIQDENVKQEKMQNILQATGFWEEKDDLDRKTAGEVFNDYVIKRLTINANGDILAEKTKEDEIDPKDELEPFNIKPRKQYSTIIKPLITKHKGDPEALYEAMKKEEKLYFPLFVCEKEGKRVFVTTFSGKGLWDDIWGYLGIAGDGRTVCGAIFDHKGETPGLGSKITEEWFENQFYKDPKSGEPKKLSASEGGAYKPIKVKKPGNPLNDFKVDGISGGTFTGVGVDEMMGRTMRVYYEFLLVNKDNI